MLGNAWWSADEVGHAVAVATPALVVADAKRAALLPPGLGVCDPTALGGVAAAPAAPRRRSRSDHDEADPAIILFTSGTTGAPKGAVLSHRSVVGTVQNLLSATNRLPSRLGAGHPGTTSLVGLPLFHVGGVQTIVNALLTGGTLVFLRGRFDAGEVLRLIETERIRVWGAVPTMVSRVMDHPDLAWRDTSSLSSLTMGGTYVPPELLERARRAFPSARRRTGTVYGMTESGGALTAVAGDDMERRPGTVGRAMPTVDLRIAEADEDGVGEIVARSPTIMDGYCGCPDDPIIDADGWLHTGDLGWLDADGYLFVLGRCKDVVIRAGENVACPHVESVLATHPAVESVAVVGLPHPDLGEEVAAAVVVRLGVEIDSHELAAYAREHLGYFQVPTRWWVRREALPTNATGKVLKRELQQQWPAEPAVA